VAERDPRNHNRVILADPPSIGASTLCLEIVTAWLELGSLETFADWKQKTQQVYGELFMKLNKSMDNPSWFFVGDSVIPEEVMKRVFQQAIDDWAFYNLKPWNRQPSCGNFLMQSSHC
jgi:hypothetical protein